MKQYANYFHRYSLYVQVKTRLIDHRVAYETIIKFFHQ